MFNPKAAHVFAHVRVSGLAAGHGEAGADATISGKSFPQVHLIGISAAILFA